MQPVDIVQAYFDRVYGDRDVEAIRQLCADPYRRHEPAGEVHLLTHDDQIARVNGVIAGSAGADGATFEFITVAIDGGADLVTVVFDMTLPADSPLASAVDGLQVADGVAVGCGIEIFRVADGVITDVWNSSVMPGRWG